MIDIQGLDFSERIFDLGKRRFEIKPLLARPAKHALYTYVRPCLESIGSVELHEKDKDGKTVTQTIDGVVYNVPRPRQSVLMEVIGRIPNDNIMKLSDLLIVKTLWFIDDDDKLSKVDNGNIDKAFMTLNAGHLTILDLRLFNVNFQDAFSELGTLLSPQAEEVSKEAEAS